MVKSLLEQLEEHINVDCDSLDPAFIKTLPIKCHDQTSNQRIVHEAIVAPENAHIVEAVVKEFKGQAWEEIYVNSVSVAQGDFGGGQTSPAVPSDHHLRSWWGVITNNPTDFFQLARIAATVIPVISGTVLSQTSPCRAHDKDYVLLDARRRHKAYLAAGIPS